MGKPDWAEGADIEAPSPARVYDYFLGGSHNFEADRRLAEKLARAMPNIGEIMRANRSFLRRAVQFLTSVGIRQFLDLGSGIPTVGNVHEIAQRVAPDAKVVYVDIDPVAITHSQAVLAGNPLTAVVEADLREPQRVLSDPRLVELLDFTRPVAVLLVGVLHQIPGDLSGLFDEYRRVLASGSYLVLSQATQDERLPEARAFQQTYNSGYPQGMQMTYRTEAEVLRFLDGLELVGPGLVQLPEWRPDLPAEEEADPWRFSTYAAVGYLP